MAEHVGRIRIWLAERSRYVRRSLRWTLAFGVLICAAAVVMLVRLSLFFHAIALMKGGG